MEYLQLDNNIEEISSMIPPQSINAEQDVLGGILSDNKAWEEIVNIVDVDDFYRQEHRILFNAIVKLLSQDKPVDIVTITEYLQQINKLNSVGGKDYIVSLVENSFSSYNIKRYAEIVRDKSILRQLSDAANDIIKKSYNTQGQDTKEILDYAESKIFKIAEQSQKDQEGLQLIKLPLIGIEKQISKLYHNENKSDITGIATGFLNLDRITSGLQEGDLIVIAGRPSMGKTAFAMNIAYNVCKDTKLPIAVFSMEMSADQLLLRMLAATGEVNQSLLRKGKLKDHDWHQFGYAIELLSDAPIYIDEAATLTPLEIKSKARRLARMYQGKLGLIVVDYIQLMTSPNIDTKNNNSNNRANEVAQISRSLKALAKELKVPVIALSQLSRNVENRSDKRPLMSDLRESGAIEQDADMIIFMYRDAYYNKNLVNTDQERVTEAIISKHRNGPTGTVKLLFLGEFAKFKDFSENYNL